MKENFRQRNILLEYTDATSEMQAHEMSCQTCLGWRRHGKLCQTGKETLMKVRLLWEEVKNLGDARKSLLDEIYLVAFAARWFENYFQYNSMPYPGMSYWRGSIVNKKEVHGDPEDGFGLLGLYASMPMRLGVYNSRRLTFDAHWEQIYEFEGAFYAVLHSLPAGAWANLVSAWCYNEGDDKASLIGFNNNYFTKEFYHVNDSESNRTRKSK